MQSFGAALYPFDYLASGQMPLFPTANPGSSGIMGVPMQLSGIYSWVGLGEGTSVYLYFSIFLSGVVGARRVKNAWPAVAADVTQPVTQTGSVSVLHGMRNI